MDPLFLVAIFVFGFIFIDIQLFHNRKAELQAELLQRRSTLSPPDWDKVEASIPDGLGREGVVKQSQNR